MTLYDTKLLLSKNKEPCDENCLFQNFNYTTSYSTCICPINNEIEDNIKNKIKEEFKENEVIDKFYELFDNGNFKYLKCFSRIYKRNIGQRHNWIIYLSAINIIIGMIFMILYYYNNHHKILEEYDSELKKSKIIEKKLISNKGNLLLLNNQNSLNLTNNNDNKIINNHLNSKSQLNLDDEGRKKLPKLILKKSVNINQTNKLNIKIENIKQSKISNIKNENINYLEMNFPQVIIKDNRKFCTIFLEYYLNKFLIGVNIKNIGIIYYPLFLMIIELNISLHTYFFINAILFSDKYISFRYSYKKKTGILFIIMNEYDRIFLVFIVSFFIIRIIRWLLDSQNDLKKAEQYLQEGISTELYINKIKHLKSIFIYKSIISNIIICLLNLFYAYFIAIFGNINSHTQIALFLSMLISLFLYFIICGITCLFISLFRILSIKKKVELLFIISNFLNHLI